MIGEDIESWVQAMGLYFATNESLTENQNAAQMALNLARLEQKWFYSIVDVSLDQLTPFSI